MDKIMYDALHGFLNLYTLTMIEEHEKHGDKIYKVMLHNINTMTEGMTEDNDAGELAIHRIMTNLIKNMRDEMTEINPEYPQA